MAAATGWAEWLAFIGLPLELSSSRGVTIHSCAEPQQRDGAGTSTEHASKRGLQRVQMKIILVPVWRQCQQLRAAVTESERLDEVSTCSAGDNETAKVKPAAEQNHCALQCAQSHSASWCLVLLLKVPSAVG